MSNLSSRLLSPRFAELGPAFVAGIAPAALTTPRLALSNAALAAGLGLDPAHLADEDALALLAGNRQPPAPGATAAVYAGHQFGVWVAQLGDGRALTLGDLTDLEGRRVELQLKGAGPTPFSRRGDGRAVLRSTLREYLASEAMHALGIPTTRALSLVVSPDPVYRETAETAAVLGRTAPSFVRFGSFEYFCHAGRHQELRELADWALAHCYPECRTEADPYLALFRQVVARTASLIAAWQAVGFCHGVMNSDNMSILGLTLDYGPFGFLDHFDPGHICNHSDHAGRYAYAEQPRIGLWNLQCLASALLPLVEREALIAELEAYQPQFEAALAERMRAKLGLTAWREEDWNLLTELFELLQHARADWTIFWRRLCDLEHRPDAVAALFGDRPAWDGWLVRYRARLADEGLPPVVRAAGMRQANPKYVLRNHLAEIAIRQAQAGDFDEARRLEAILARPFDEQPEHEAYADFPPAWAGQLSVSCSS